MTTLPRDTEAQAPVPASVRSEGPMGIGGRVGVDTGGTFTDLVSVDPSGELHVAKVRSTPEDPGRALVEGLAELEGRRGAADDHATIIHGTTVALNALLTGRTPGAALVTNEGFRDLVEIDRQARPELYTLEPERPAPLVPRDRRFVIGQRSWPDPTSTEARAPIVEALRPTDEEIAAVCDAAAASGATSVAVCLLHSYADPEPENRIVRALRARGLDATSSANLVPEYREAERFSTAVCNAALVPVVRAYLERLGGALEGRTLEVLQSSGGGLAAERAAQEPVRVLLSGPAGGVVGAARAARDAGLGSIATLDMGGTSTDVAFHAAGSGLGSLGEGVQIAGHSIAVPTLDMHTIGCGGGSLATVDAGGILRVGPASAGADPGPVAFGRGGTEPTVTDAYVALGRVPLVPHPGGFLGGAFELDVDGAIRAFEVLGRQLGVDAQRAAAAVIDAANASMRRAASVMTMQRGRDPRDTPLVAFGGGGGLAGAELARALGMPSALVPWAPGVLSAYGMTQAERTADRSRTVLRPIDGMDASERGRLFAELRDEALTSLGLDPQRSAEVAVETSVALRYAGQSYELALPESQDLAGVFHAAHEARFGWRLDEHSVELVHMRLRASVLRTATGQPTATGLRTATEMRTATGEDMNVQVAPSPTATSSAVVTTQRTRIDGVDVEVPILDRRELSPGAIVDGPALVDEYTGTTYLPPGSRARVTPGRGLLIEFDV